MNSNPFSAALYHDTLTNFVGNFFSYFATKGLNVQKEEELPPPVIEYLDNSVKTDLASIL